MFDVSSKLFGGGGGQWQVYSLLWCSSAREPCWNLSAELWEGEDRDEEDDEPRGCVSIFDGKGGLVAEFEANVGAIRAVCADKNGQIFVGGTANGVQVFGFDKSA